MSANEGKDDWSTNYPSVLCQKMIPIWITKCNMSWSALKCLFCLTGICVTTQCGRGLWLTFREQTAAVLHDVIIPNPSVICYHTSARSYHHSKRSGSNERAPTTHPYHSLMPSRELIFSLHQWLKPWHEEWGRAQIPAATSATVTSSELESWCPGWAAGHHSLIQQLACRRSNKHTLLDIFGIV